MPESEFKSLKQLKARALALTRPVKKSELLRAGLAALESMNDNDLLSALDRVAQGEAGRVKAKRSSKKR